MLALAALVFARLSSAAPSVAAPPVDLTWQAPGECPDGDAVLHMVAGLLRQPTGDDAAGRAVARGLVSRAGATWELRLALRGRGSDYRRTVRAESCQLARAAALLIAIHLDPLAVTRGLPAAAVVPPAPPARPPDLSSGTATSPPPGPSDLSPRTSTPSLPGTAPPADLSPRTSTPSPRRAFPTDILDLRVRHGPRPVPTDILDLRVRPGPRPVPTDILDLRVRRPVLADIPCVATRPLREAGPTAPPA
ncbi:hypothetical protein OV079_05465 [Nannocystis pusilla]|uniref:Uncharacterized protein n=1 Tax=Nannocystis pusilla TaxID=889268 RepID=A0A9X3EJ80_9BACT|nr:hypothetical protein [Nannocystis pusilla]MCY1005027.1 hypothetical protein [Nannocystis pusilla]